MLFLLVNFIFLFLHFPWFSSKALQITGSRVLSLFRYLRCPMNRLGANKNSGDVSTIANFCKYLPSSTGYLMWGLLGLCWGAGLYLLKEANELPGFLWKNNSDYFWGTDGSRWVFWMNVRMENSKQIQFMVVFAWLLLCWVSPSPFKWDTAALLWLTSGWCAGNSRNWTSVCIGFW